MTVYMRPSGLEEALGEISREGSAALAGGTDLVGQRRAGDVRADRLVDVKALSELGGDISTADARLIGARTTMAELSAACAEDDALRDGASVVGSLQTRHRATLGGNICRSSPAGDTLPALLVLDARFELRSMDGVRQVAAAEFFTGPGANVKTPDELLTTIELPARAGASAYQRLTYRAWMDLAVVGVAAWVDVRDQVCVDAAVAVGGAAPTPLLVPGAATALVGSRAEPPAVAAAAAAVADVALPIDDVRGSASYRRAVLAPLTERVVAAALARAAQPRRPVLGADAA